MDGVGWLGSVLLVPLLATALLVPLHLFALVDAARRPAAAFHGQSLGRRAWLVLLGVALVAVGPGSVVGLWYLLVRRGTRRGETQARSVGGVEAGRRRGGGEI